MATQRVNIDVSLAVDIVPVIVEPNLRQKIGEAQLVLRKCGASGAQRNGRSDEDFLAFLLEMMKRNKIFLGMSDEECKKKKPLMQAATKKRRERESKERYKLELTLVDEVAREVILRDPSLADAFVDFRKRYDSHESIDFESVRERHIRSMAMPKLAKADLPQYMWSEFMGEKERNPSCQRDGLLVRYDKLKRELIVQEGIISSAEALIRENTRK